MLSQTTAITAVNLKSIPERWGSSLVIVVGLAGVVAVFTALLAMAEGFQHTLKAAGREDVAMIMRGGSSGSELNSALDRDSATLIRQAPGIAKDEAGQPLASSELLVISELKRPGQKTGSNVTLRGLEPNGLKLRPQVKIAEGRPFTPGLRELLVGRGVTRQFEGANIGDVIRMRGSDWTVVGIFESGDANESEIWVDAGTAQSSFGRQGFSSIRAQLESKDSLQKLKDALTADPRLEVDVQREVDYYSSQTKQFRMMIGILAGFVTAIMALGAIFAALNTMYAAVSARAREIATLRAIGFGGMPVVASVMIEALLLSILGGLLGAAIAYVLFNGLSVATLGQNFTQVVFSFRITPDLVVVGLFIAVIVGMVGGVVPASRTAGQFVNRHWVIMFTLSIVAGLVAFYFSIAKAGPVGALVSAVVTTLALMLLGALTMLLVRALVRKRVDGGLTGVGSRIAISVLALLLGVLLFGMYGAVLVLIALWHRRPHALVEDSILSTLRAA